MTEDEFRNLLEDHLVPMLAVTNLGAAQPSARGHALVAYEHPRALLMKPTRDEDYRVRLERSQPFTSEETYKARVATIPLTSIPEPETLSLYAFDL
jgi:hypothetical protein